MSTGSNSNSAQVETASVGTISSSAPAALPGPPAPVIAQDRRVWRAPRVGEVFWVHFWDSAIPPEMIPIHPGIVVRGGQKTDDPVVVVPMTTRAQKPLPYIYQFPVNPVPWDQRAGKVAFALCHHFYTVGTFRLAQFEHSGRIQIPLITDADKQAIFSRIAVALPGLTRYGGLILGTPPADRGERPASSAPTRGPNTLTLKPKAQVGE